MATGGGCDACGAESLRLVETYAAVGDGVEVDVAVWRCLRCGGRSEEAVPVAVGHDADAGQLA